MNDICISKPFIQNQDNDLYRLCANISLMWGGQRTEETVFVEVEKEYKDYLCVERSDAFVFLVLPIAIREGYDICCEAPVTEMFLHNLQTILLPALIKGDPRAKNIKINAPKENTPLQVKGAVGASVTCGVDSTYTIMEYTNGNYSSMQLTHLVVASVSSDLWDFDENDNLKSWEEKHSLRFERYNTISEYTKLPIVKIFTNFAPFIIKRKKINKMYTHVHVHTFITIGTILTLKKLFGTYIYSSGYDYSNFSLNDNLTTDPADYELLLMHILSNPDFMCFSGGATVNRIDKTIALTEYPLARKTLHPCFKNGKINCSLPNCSKCMRGLFTLDYYDKLDEMSEVFDIEKYRKNRPQYLISLIKSKKSPNFALLYDMFEKKYPEDMKYAQEKLEKDSDMVSREEYDVLLRAYDTLLLLLSKEVPKNTIVNYFKNKGIKKLYYAGDSRFGRKIVELLSEDIEIISFKTGNINTCDAVFIGSTSDKVIAKMKEEILKKINSEKDIYTIVDIRKVLSNIE